MVSSGAEKTRDQLELIPRSVFVKHRKGERDCPILVLYCGQARVWKYLHFTLSILHLCWERTSVQLERFVEYFMHPRIRLKWCMSVNQSFHTKNRLLLNSQAFSDPWRRSKQLSSNEKASREVLSNHNIFIPFAPSSRIRSSLTL